MRLNFEKIGKEGVKKQSLLHINNQNSLFNLPTTTPESEALSKDLKKRGMTFVGSTIIYAFMQAVGMTNDHIKECWKTNYRN